MAYLCVIFHNRQPCERCHKTENNHTRQVVTSMLLCCFYRLFYTWRHKRHATFKTNETEGGHAPQAVKEQQHHTLCCLHIRRVYHKEPYGDIWIPSPDNTLFKQPWKDGRFSQIYRRNQSKWTHDGSIGKIIHILQTRRKREVVWIYRPVQCFKSSRLLYHLAVKSRIFRHLW